jgi:GxxExxY protein
LDIEDLSSIVIDCGYHLHVDLGPGLLESAYEAIFKAILREKGLKVDRQVPIKIRYRNIILEEGFRADLLIENKLLIELKSLEKMSAVHGKQVLTYLRLLNLPMALLINFGAPTFKEGVRRVVNNHQDFASSRLRVNKNVTAIESRNAAK